jgi:hypothetical protein
VCELSSTRSTTPVGKKNEEKNEEKKMKKKKYTERAARCVTVCELSSTRSTTPVEKKNEPKKNAQSAPLAASMLTYADVC